MKDFDIVSFLMGTKSGGGGGGGGDLPLLTRAQWNALSTAQKQAYGLVAIQDANSGFDRGELYYGASYKPIGYYIPNSTPANIVCEAYLDNFNPYAPMWGDGANAINLSTGLYPTVSSEENAVYLGVAATGKAAYVDLEATAAPYTAYIVAKLISPGQYQRVMSSMAARSANCGMLMFGSTIMVSSWASDTDTGVSSSSAFFTAAMQFNGSNAGAGMVTSSGSCITKNPITSDRYLAIGSTDLTVGSPSDSNTAPSNLYVRYFAVTTDYESEATIRANLANLESVFIQ